MRSRPAIDFTGRGFLPCVRIYRCTHRHQLELAHPIMEGRASPVARASFFPLASRRGEREDGAIDRGLTFARAPLHVERADLRVAQELADALLVVAVLERQVERGRHRVLVRQQHGDGLAQIIGERRQLDERHVLRLRGRFPGAVQGIAHARVASIPTTRSLPVVRSSLVSLLRGIVRKIGISPRVGGGSNPLYSGMNRRATVCRIHASPA